MGLLNDDRIVGCSEPLLPSSEAGKKQQEKAPIQIGHVHLLPPHAAHIEEEDDQCVEAPEDIVSAVKLLLHGLGEDPQRFGLAKTPLRVARAFLFATRGYHQLTEDIVGDALFPESGVEAGLGYGGGLGGLVVVKNIDLFSMCDSCLLPFKVCCHVGYISAGCQVVGLSKLSRVADVFAQRLQSPQKLAEDIAQGLLESIKPLGVAVVAQCSHLPVPGLYDDENLARLSSADEVLNPAFKAVAGNGSFNDRNSDVWKEFLTMLRLDDICFNSTESCGFTGKAWCPCILSQKDTCGLPTEFPVNAFSRCALEHGIASNPVITTTESGDYVSYMLTAAKIILNAIGVDMSDDVLLLTPKRLVEWLLNFKKRSKEPEFETLRLGKSRKFTVLNGYEPDLKANIETSDDNFTFVLDAPFCSLCEHHLLPFYGRAHVAYLETDELIDRQAISTIIKALSQRLQVQERLTREIAETIICYFNIQSIAVIVEATHICMVSRGIKKLGSSTITVAVFGRFATDVNAKVAFLKEINLKHTKKCNT